MNKKGFSLGEVLCAMTIVGIISILALTTVNPSKKAVRYQYINAYNALNKAYYNGMAQGYNPFTTQQVDNQDPVHTDTKDTGALQLCRALTTYINTKDNTRGTNANGQAYDYSNTCSDSKIVSELGTEFLSTENMTKEEKNNLITDRENKIQFTASNGMKFYISKMLGDDDAKFYLVFVDINGDKKPNTIEYSYYKNGTVRTEPDIHAFAMLESGRVVPLGAAEYDPNLLTARVAYFDEDGGVKYTKMSQAYYQAKGQAWGYYSSTDMETSKTISDETELYSMNDILRSKLDANSIIVTAFPDLTKLKPLSVLSSGEYGCANGDFESCYIILDEFRQY